MENINLSRILLVCSLCITLSTARAQYVAIPDSNFGNWLLNNGYSSCLTGNSVSGFRLDTTCSALSANSIYCYYSNIYDLTGIQYFHNLTYVDCGDNHLASLLPLLPVSSTLLSLRCSNNPLDSLIALPNSLQSLICDSDQLTSLPMLPPTMTHLECSYNQLVSLPVLPASISYLDCGDNGITALPALPDSLQTLYCDVNQLTSLPTLPGSVVTIFCMDNTLASIPALPSSLTTLLCFNNNLTSLPVLPAGLVDLDCESNYLSSLPMLPSSLGQLYCGYNPLTSIPSLPMNLWDLICDSAQLTSLPPLPAQLYTLTCSHNPLYSLPALPPSLVALDCSFSRITGLLAIPDSLTYLNCSGNPSLTCLSRIFSQVLQQFNISNTAITCLPNSFTALYFDVDPASLPLCDASSGCPLYYNIAGNVHSDTSANCALDSLNPGHPITDLKVQLLQNGQVVQQFYTFTSGNYSFQVPSLTNYTVSVDTTGLPLSIVCPVSGGQSVSLSPTDSVVTGVDFGMVCSNFDYGVGYIWGHHFRPTFTSHVHIGAGNIARVLHSIDCGAGMAGTVTTTLGGSITYVSPATGALTPTSVSGNVLTYNLADLDSLTWGSLDIIVLTDTGAVAGTDACFTTIISPATADMNPYDDTLSRCFTIVHSWDPNEKEVSPANISESGGWLTYTVAFQNTGTDTAYTVIVRDTLSQYVDASTFQYLAASSKPVIQLVGNAVTFTFPHINLVDSATNPSLSEAWVQYKVKPKANLPDQTQINNTAYVYFDQNPAVVTNTAVTNVNPTGIKPVLSNNIIKLYPNPNKGTFTMETSNSVNSKYTIMDMLGHVITEQTITTDKQTINMAEVADGVYTLIVKGAQPLRFTVVR